MKKTLIILGVLFLVLIVVLVGVLVWAGSVGQAKQEQFFRAVMSGDAKQVTAMFHPALRDEVTSRCWPSGCGQPATTWRVQGASARRLQHQC